MTYVASPSSAVGDPGRVSNLKQCLGTARKRLDETSRSSNTEKEDELISSAVQAGWNEDEVRQALSGDDKRQSDAPQPMPTIGLVPSSSM